MPVCKESELTIDKIIYNPPVATIVFWNDGTKTISKCEVGDVYSPELGFALCVLKKKYGSKKVHTMLDKYVYDVVNSENADEWGRVVWDRRDKKSCKEPQESKAPIYIKVHNNDIAFKVGDDKHDTYLADLLDMIADVLFGEGSDK